jgi:hypothetical protein
MEPIFTPWIRWETRAYLTHASPPMLDTAVSDA